MTECPNAEMRDHLPDLANDSLAPAVRVVVLAHISECSECTAEIEILRVARWVVIESTPAVNVGAIVSALPRRGATPITTARSARGFISASSWRIAAAITVLVAGAGSYAVMQDRTGISTSDSVAATAFVADSSAGLALTGTLAELDEAELQALVDGLGAIEALPDPNVETERISVPREVIPDSVLRDLEGD